MDPLLRTFSLKNRASANPDIDEISLRDYYKLIVSNRNPALKSSGWKKGF